MENMFISPCLNLSKLEPTVRGMLETILVNIIKDMPFPIPFSLICSPNQTKNNVPETKVSIIIR